MSLTDSRDNWVTLLKQIGLNPIVPDDNDHLIEVDYLGQLITILFDVEDLILVGSSICLLKNTDALSLNRYLEAVRIASRDEAVPKIILLQPYGSGERPIQAWHSLFLDFNFEDKSLEKENQETLIRILNSIVSASQIIIQCLTEFEERNMNSINN